MAIWHTIESIRTEWNDAEQIEDALLGELLEVARDGVVAYAPTLADPEVIPTRYRLGQMMQVRNLWNAAMVSTSDGIGGETYVIQPRPLDWHVKQILRPAQGVPKVA